MMLMLAACAPGEPTATPDPEGPTPTPTPTAEPSPAPTPPDDEVEEGAWEELPDAPIAARFNHSATWADGQVIVWGGEDQETFEIAADGAAWDPATGEWAPIPEAPIEGRWAHEAVWTGDELIVWGGTAGPDHLAACYTDGGRYDPAAGEWEPIPEAPGEARCGAAVAWSGDELLVFGGHAGEGPPVPGDRHDDGVAYDPDTGEWRELPAAPLAPRAGAVAGWVGDELIVYGGHTGGEEADGFDYLDDGAAYDPQTDAWRELPESPLPPLSGIHGVAAGDELILFGGQAPDPAEADHSTATVGYDPQADAWRVLADLPGPQAVAEVAWTGDVVYVLGGGAPADAEGEDHVFLAYVPADDTWVPRPDPPDGSRNHHAIAWTGAELVLWGGQTEATEAPGARWDPPG